MGFLPLLPVLRVSVVEYDKETLTTETRRTQRWQREPKISIRVGLSDFVDRPQVSGIQSAGARGLLFHLINSLLSFQNHSAQLVKFVERDVYRRPINPCISV